jgi:hypothetical protein
MPVNLQKVTGTSGTNRLKSLIHDTDDNDDDGDNDAVIYTVITISGRLIGPLFN